MPGHTLHDLDKLVAKFPKGVPPKSYQGFVKIFGR